MGIHQMRKLTDMKKFTMPEIKRLSAATGSPFFSNGKPHGPNGDYSRAERHTFTGSTCTYFITEDKVTFSHATEIKYIVWEFRHLDSSIMIAPWLDNPTNSFSDKQHAIELCEGLEILNSHDSLDAQTRRRLNYAGKN